MKKLLIAIAVAGMLFGCAPAAKSDKITIVTTMYPLYDFSQKVGGDKVEVINLTEGLGSSHGFELSAQDKVKIEKADIFVYNGAGMESWIDSLVNSIENKDLVLVDSSKNVKLLPSSHSHEHEEEHEEEHNHEEEHEHEDEHNHDDDHDHEEHNDEEDHDHAHGEYDPHIWLYPLNAKIQMENIKNALITVDESNKDYYEDNFTQYSKKLESLDEKYKESISEFTYDTIVVNHKAFGYITENYGLHQVSISGVHADSEPSAKVLAEIISFVKENNVKYILIETLGNQKIVDTIQNEANVKIEVLSPIEVLTSEQVSAKEDYFSMMEKNLEVLKKVLND